jgi:hypothetical protein
MADAKISALTSATTPLAGTEVLPIVQSSTTVKVTVDNLTVKNVRSNATTGILQVDGPTAATTRVMTTPDANFTAARTDAAQTFTGQQTFSSGIVANSIYTDVGSEIIVNGTFDSTTANWTAANTAVLSIVAGGFSGNALQVSGTSYGRADQSFTTIVGCRYQVSAYYKNGTTSGIFRISSAAGGAGDIVDLAVNNAAWTQLTTAFTATTTTTYVNLFEDASGTMLWDNISVKQFALSIASDASIAGNLVVTTTSKGVTTGSSIPLGLGTNNTNTGISIATTGIITMAAYGAGAATFSAAGVISSVSDENWKRKDGVPTNPTEMLSKIEPGYWYYNGKYKDTFGVDRQLGFYAQNINAAIGPEAAPEPEFITVTDDQGVETLQQKPWGYYDRSVLAVVVMALQEALATVKELEVRIQVLEGKS